ncbi:MAG: DNA polymerase III subunit delta [Planctomycetota bacterium]|jgi:DNA polymerase III delta subunit
MDYTAFAAGVKSRRKLSPAYLFFGEEGYLRRRGAELVRGADPAFAENTIRVSSSETTWAKLLSELCTPPFLGGRKLVLLVDEGNFIHNEASNLKAYVNTPSPAAVLAVLSPMAKCPVPFESPRLVLVRCRPLGAADVRRWIQTEIQRRGKSMDRATADLLIGRAGTDLSTLDGYLDTLSLHSGKREQILAKDVEALVGDESEFKVFELALAAAHKDRPGALVVLHGLREGGENPHALLWRLAWQYRKMVEAKRLLEAGVRRFEAAARLQITYYQDKFLSMVDAHSLEELLEKHQALLDADLALKTSGSGTEEAVLDALVCRLSEAPAAVS